MHMLATLVGIVGVALVLIAYALLQSGRWRQDQRRYSLANASGAALILVSLAYDFNLPSAVIESVWLVISLYGLWRASSQG